MRSTSALLLLSLLLASSPCPGRAQTPTAPPRPNPLLAPLSVTGLFAASSPAASCPSAGAGVLSPPATVPLYTCSPASALHLYARLATDNVTGALAARSYADAGLVLYAYTSVYQCALDSDRRLHVNVFNFTRGALTQAQPCARGAVSNSSAALLVLPFPAASASASASPRPSGRAPLPPGAGAAAGQPFAVDPAKYSAAASLSVLLSATCSLALAALAWQHGRQPPSDDAAAAATAAAAFAAPAAAKHAPRAARAWPAMLAAHALLSLGLLMGLGALGALLGSANAANPLEPTTPPAAALSVVALLAAALPATAMAGVAAIRLRKLAARGELPPARAPCAPSAPAIVTCAWVAAGVYTLAGAATRFPAYGLGLDVCAALALLGGGVLASLSSCQMGAVPGLGPARSCACCVAGGGEGEEWAGSAAAPEEGAHAGLVSGVIHVRSPEEAREALAALAAGASLDMIAQAQTAARAQAAVAAGRGAAAPPPPPPPPPPPLPPRQPRAPAAALAALPGSASAAGDAPLPSLQEAQALEQALQAPVLPPGVVDAQPAEAELDARASSSALV